MSPTLAHARIIRTSSDEFKAICKWSFADSYVVRLLTSDILVRAATGNCRIWVYSTVAAAILIARYLIPHAEAVLNMMLAREETTDIDARYLLRWIERHNRLEFTKSEAQHHGKRRFPRADDIDPALAELTRRLGSRCATAATSVQPF